MSYSPDNLLGTTDPVPCLPLAILVATDTPVPSHPGWLLHLDCSALPYPRSLGVCHQVSQLLRLRRTGVRIILHHVHPLLRRCLYLLKVAHLFAWAA